MKAFEQRNQLTYNISQASKNVDPTNLTAVVGKVQLQTRSLKKLDNGFDTSFEKGATYEYPEMIWTASQNYLKKSYIGETDFKQGLNDEKIFPQFESDQDDKDLQNVIGRNSLLSQREKNQIITDLKYETGLKVVFEKLCGMFREQIFHQILYVGNCSWEKYLSFKENSKMSPSLQNMNLQSIFDFNSEEENKELQAKNSYIYLQEQQILKETQKVAGEISSQIYLKKNFNYINLMEAVGTKTREIREQFTKFIESIVSAVFLCLEGFYEGTHFQQEESVESNYSVYHQSFEESEESISICRKYRKIQ